MDVYWGGVGASAAVLDDRLPRLVGELRAGHGLATRCGMVAQACRHDAGESRWWSGDGIDVLFDGYVHGLGVRSVEEFLPELGQRVLDRAPLLVGDESGVFNVVVHRHVDRSLHLANDPSGLLPLYFAAHGEQFWFASHVHLAARALGAAPDLLGVTSKIVFGFPLGSRTLFDGIEHLNPGERVSWEPSSGSVVRCYPEVYFDRYEEHGPRESTAMWEALLAAVAPLRTGDGAIGVMLSEGFDSRLIAGALHHSGIPVSTFTHGTEGTRGARIVEQVSDAVGTELCFEPMASGYPADLAALRRQLFLADNLHIPYWSFGTEHFARSDVRAVTTGYALDTTIGGHAFYLTDVSNRRRAYQRFEGIVLQDLRLLTPHRIERLAGDLLDRARRPSKEAALARIRSYLAPEYADLLAGQVEQLGEEVDAELDRVRRSGSTLPSHLVQRYFLENRVRKHSFGQELTLRTANRVVVPSYEPVFMRLVSSVHPRHRLYHDAYIDMMRRHLRDLAKIENGGYGLPVTFPRVVLEASHVALKRLEERRVKEYLRTKGAAGVAWYRGVNFGDATARRADRFALEELLEDEGCVMDSGLRANLDRIRSYRGRVFLTPLFMGIELSEVFGNR